MKYEVDMERLRERSMARNCGEIIGLRLSQQAKKPARRRVRGVEYF
jgi:hypothetical protein